MTRTLWLLSALTFALLLTGSLLIRWTEEETLEVRARRNGL